MSVASSSIANSEAEAIRRRDALPLWVVIVLIVFLVARLYNVGVAPFLTHKSAAKSVPVAKDSGLDDASMQDLLQVDLQAKTAYATTLGKPGPVVRPDVKTLRAALKAAGELQRDSGNSPSSARRLLLLRAVLNLAAPGTRNVPPLSAGLHGLLPLDAFGSALPADLPAADRAQYTQEGLLWQRVFAGGSLTAHQTAAAAAQIRRLPNIRWWQYPALQALYAGQGDLSEAGRYTGEARDSALPSLVPFGLFGAFRLGLILVGLLLLIYFAIRATGERGEQAPNIPPPTDLWPTVPDAIPFAARKLGAGDLMGVFVLYLLTSEALGIILGGLADTHVPLLGHFHGLLAPYRPRIERLPAQQRTTIGILLESAVYLLSAVPPFIMLGMLARRRGASLADEIGWTRRKLGLNLVYGVGGFAIASCLMVPVALLGARLFRHAPDPSNPVIPQLIGTSGILGPLVLVLLASFAAPVVEELLFRGVFYNAAKMRLGVWPAIVLTGLVFGFIHPVGIAQMFALGTLGGVFAWMAETRKSLAPSMFAHFLQNFTTTILLLTVLSG